MKLQKMWIQIRKMTKDVGPGFADILHPVSGLTNTDLHRLRVRGPMKDPAMAVKGKPLAHMHRFRETNVHVPKYLSHSVVPAILRRVLQPKGLSL